MRSLLTIRHRTWIVLLFKVLGITLLFGLYPKEYDLRNHAEWMDDGPGIAFQKYGIAYSEPIPIAKDAAADFTIEMAIHLEPGNGKGFQHLLVFHDGTDSAQMMLGQWQDSLVFMKGDDYANKRREKKMWLDAAGLVEKDLLLTLTSNAAATMIFVNGQPVKVQRNWKPEIPSGEGGTRLVLGNSVYGKHPWTGAVKGLSVYRMALTAEQIEFHYREWVTQGAYRLPDGEKPWLLYTFDAKGREIPDQGRGGVNLTIPERVTVLKKNFLNSSFDELKFSAGAAADILVNWIGFIPYGFVCSAVLARSLGLSPAMVLLAAVGSGFLLSLGIEIAQAWIPSRSSDLIDLLLNTAGTFCGTLLWKSVTRKQRARQNPEDPLPTA